VARLRVNLSQVVPLLRCWTWDELDWVLLGPDAVEAVTFHVPRGPRAGVWTVQDGKANNPAKADPRDLVGGPTVEPVGVASDGFGHPQAADLSVQALRSKAAKRVLNRARLSVPSLPANLSAWEALRLFADKNLVTVGRALRLGRAALNEFGRLLLLEAEQRQDAQRVQLLRKPFVGFTRLTGEKLDRFLLPLSSTGEVLVRLAKHDSTPWGSPLPQKW